ncbi:MAG: aspartate 1-decarboxylase [Planctomycetaceae bacterium]|nr:aspartate 1-decarboxylase [Planctomycetaceae bacterium]
MRRTLLKSKIHRATVTQAELHYEGSVTIDKLLLEAANIIDHERVDIYNITNGNRLTTYAIDGEPGSGTICINGAAAHLMNPGDLVIIASYAEYEEAEVADYKPVIVQVDTRNRMADGMVSCTEPSKEVC